ncbi:MAG: neutral/alkaline non-lysosomal ceramidase N-terminal domain-containing protein [Deltaproteobacteria bacterium]
MLKKLTAWGAAAMGATLLILAIFPVHGTRDPAPPRVTSAVRGQGILSAGAVAVPLSAPAGAPIGGYPRLRYGSTGVEDEPMVRVIVLSEPGASMAIASVDVLLVPAALREKVEKRLSDLRLDAVLVGATHTHSGPGGFWDDALGARFGTGPYDRAFEEALAGRIADAIRAAAAIRGPAQVSVARSRRPDLVRNRAGGDPGGRLLALRVERPGGDVVGQIVVFPAHATVHGSSNRLLSADWPGALARSLPGVTVFLQGAEGDQTYVLPSPHPGPTHAAYGRLVADEVARLPYPPGDRAPELAAAEAEVGLPAPSFGAVPAFLDRLLQNLLWSWMPARTRVVVVRIGPATLLAVPAEPGVAVGETWRGAAGGDAEVVSLVGDYVGYVETPERVKARTGEAKRTYLGPELAPVLQRGLAAAQGALPPARP